MSALPVLAARSMTTLPSLAWIRPRCVEVFMWSASKVTTVWPGSMVNVAGSAATPAAAAPSDGGDEELAHGRISWFVG